VFRKIGTLIFFHPYSILKENQVINHFYQTKGTKIHKGLHYPGIVAEINELSVFDGVMNIHALNNEYVILMS